MLKNYFKTAWRNVFRNKTFSLIKILGLSLGLTVCMLIFLYTKDEVSYDQFHANKAQLYRITQTWKIGTTPARTIGITNAVVGGAFAKEIPGVQQSIRVRSSAATVKRDNQLFSETPLFVDDNYLSLFTFPMVEGHAKTALTDIHSMVVSKDVAKKYFGTTDVIGKTLQVKVADDFEVFNITGVTENTPQNSTLNANILLPYKYFDKYNNNTGWLGGSLATFLMIAPNTDTKAMLAKMQVLFDANTKEKREKAKQQQGTTINISLGLQPLTAMHLDTNVDADNGLVNSSSPMYSYILTCIAIFILVIACINFINLAVAQSLSRSKEIGVRKVMGSTRRQLVKQFLAESFLISLIAFIVAFVLTITVLPFFNQLANKKLSLAYLSDGWLYAGYFALLLVTSFIAGFYPSLVLSSFQPVKVLYGKLKLNGRNYLTRGLIVLQFALAIFLIIGTITINRQLNFVEHADLGYDSKNLVKIDIPISDMSENLPTQFKLALANNSDIVSVAAKHGGRSISGARANGKQIEIENNKIDDAFFSTFKIPVLAGRAFSPAHPTDSFQSVIVNESFVKEAGWTAQQAIGKNIDGPNNDKGQLTIVGVVKDYHFLSLKEKITPALYTMNPRFNFGEIWVRIKPNDVPKTLALLESTFKKVVPYYPYSYQFMDDINAKNYETETRWKQIISIASMLFIFISCIGLFGLVILSVEQRTKEIGIRKVLGAAVSRIVVLISKEFVILITITFVIAAPVGYYFIDKWLQSFAYRITPAWWMFALAGGLVIGLALLTLSYQAIKAALANPVKSLRNA